MTTPPWLDRIHDLDARANAMRLALGPIADERARIIEAAVTEAGRGGRDTVAAAMGISVGQVDQAIKRARNAPRATSLPHDLLDRLYALELADLPPQPAHRWHALTQMLAGTFIDTTWIENPAGILAQEIDDATGDDEEFLPEDGEPMAAAVRTWTRMQALAVLDAITRRDLTALPTEEDQ